MIPLVLKYVSRETLPLFERYIDLLKLWNRKTGLIQEHTFEEVWERHILDSLQLITYLPDPLTSILDIGSGGGFPGIVLAISGYINITLCESNMRKSVFLEEVIRQLGLQAQVKNVRAETIQEKYQIVTSRACADLSTLLNLMKTVSRETTSKGVFLKGKTALKEIAEAKEKWAFQEEIYPSITEKEGKIIIIHNLTSKLRGQ